MGHTLTPRRELSMLVDIINFKLCMTHATRQRTNTHGITYDTKL